MAYSLYGIDHARRLKYAYLTQGTLAFEDKRTNTRGRVLTTSERATVIATLTTKQPKDVILASSAKHWSTSLLG